MIRRLVTFFAATALLAGCTSNGNAAPVETTATPEISPGPAYTLRVLGGSELADLKPILDEAAKATGVTVKMDYAGSLEGAETVATGKADGKYDAIWFSSDRYLTTVPGGKERLATATSIMASPVVLGLRQSVATRLGWAGGKQVTWSDIAAAAGRDDFTFAMTDPSASNTGFSALVAIASALDGSGRAVDAAAVERVAEPLAGFFGAQRMTAGSSGWLTDAYLRQQPPVDGLINYEASLDQLNRSGKAGEPLTIVYPADGVVSADYPLTLLSGASTEARDAHERLAAFLRTPSAQQKIGQQTSRRPAVPGVALPQGLPGSLVELPFPGTKQAADALLSAYADRLRRPSRTVYALDVSGSMRGTRLTTLKSAVSGLTGVNTSLTGEQCRFRSREEVYLLPFSTRPQSPRPFTIDESNPQPSRDGVRKAAQSLKAGGDTAVYDSLIAAYRAVDAAKDKNRFHSIVLMTDGESNQGAGLQQFKQFIGTRGSNATPVPVFPVLFGEAAESQMRSVATLTGGEVFDARKDDLTSVFCQIRGYQ
jgi:Ca-activated chloride channel homolog